MLFIYDIILTGDRMKLYNTLTKKLEDFIPNEGKKVKLYTCGPTVYYYAHIGNLRTYISEDMLEKSLTYLGYDVSRCMNITDVGHLVSDADTGEDKMAVAAVREHKSVLDIARFYTEEFFKDMAKLNIKKPEFVSNATDNIDEYIKVISKLIKDGYAYIANGNVYFDTEKYEDYYKLSGRNKEDLLTAVRDDVEEDEFKKNPADFGLWFTNSKFDSQELKWDSPWGIGYPGWHIECSCISMKYLGETLDIHCGAVDAIFPHHTNEIAQAECYLGHKWCNYWVHLEFLNDATGKMSKSKGGFLTLSVLEDKGYNPLEYRYFCLGSSYRNLLTFTYEGLDSAASAYQKLISKIKTIKKDDSIIDTNKFNEYKEKFSNALSDNLNTSNVLTILYDLLKEDINNNTKLSIIKDIDQVLSLDLIKEEIKINEELENYILDMINKRNEAKKNKDFITSDSIREELLNKGIVIKDTREGTTYEVI